jgi:uncharacterized GH25 family protein
MHKLTATGLAMLACSAPAFAHEFWLEPANFRPAAGTAQMVEFYLGDGLVREEWDVRWERVQSLRSYSAGGVEDQQIGIREGEAEGMAEVTLKYVGGHVVAFESKPSFLELPSGEFNEYIRHEGITPIIAEREAKKTQEQPGRETYSRRAKALVRVGSGPEDVFTRPIGMTLEIVPGKNPYALAPGEVLPVTVLFHGKALAGAQIELARLDRMTDPFTVAKTDAGGRASFSFAREGRWRLSVIWSFPLTNRAKADYDTTFSSLTFGY